MDGADGVTTKAEQAYAQVRELILAGELRPGSVLNQAALAARIGISTTPLREALRRLSQQGLVSLGAHRDALVAPLDAAEARDLLEMRQHLDPLAAGLAAGRRTAEDLAAISTALGRLESLPRNPSVAQLDSHRSLHAAIYRASHNAVLVETLDGLWDKTERYRRHGLEVARDDAELAQRAAEHTALVEAISDRDADAATDLMRRHVETSLGARSAGRLGRPPVPAGRS